MAEHQSTDQSAKESRRNVLLHIYDKHYMKLLIVSIALLLFSFVVIGHQYVTTGDFVSRGVSLTGGLSITLPAPTQNTMTADDLQMYLVKELPKGDILVRTFGSETSQKFSIEAAGVSEDELINALKPKFPELTTNDFNNNKQTIGPTFGEAFFTQTLKAIFIAFLFMSIVIFLYFGESTRDKWISSILTIIAAFTMFYAKSAFAYISAVLLLVVLIVIYIRDSIPAFGIILCAFSDLFFSLAIFNITGHKLSIASVAAFLMVVGYSIDTDILLSVRVLKRREGTLSHRILGAMKTGITMSVCTLTAVITAYFLTHSIVIKEIMFVLIAGLVGDIIFTWVQNAGLLRWHLERKGWK